MSWRKDRLPTPVFLGFPCGSAGKESTYNAGALGLIPGLGRSPGEGKAFPLQYSDLENSMDCIVHKVTKRQILLSVFLSVKCITFRPKYDIKYKKVIVIHRISCERREDLMYRLCALEDSFESYLLPYMQTFFFNESSF